MRYDNTDLDSTNAHDIVNTSTEFELIEIFKRFGEEKYSEQLAKTIVEERHG